MEMGMDMEVEAQVEIEMVMEVGNTIALLWIVEHIWRWRGRWEERLPMKSKQTHLPDCVWLGEWRWG